MQRSVRIGLALVLLAATCIGVGLILTQSAEAHGTCADHQYRTYDGTHDGDGDGVGCESKPAPPGRSDTGSSTTGGTSTGSHPAEHRTCASHQYRTYDGTHDGDGDGVGCESKPEPPSRSGVTSVGYDRDNWSFNSSGARARLGCSSSEHVDHIVALKEAYDSGAAAWSSTRKAEFANDPANLWCLAASVNLSKSDGDLAEWVGGSCAQRKRIATVTQQVKRTYGLSTDGAEQRAITAASAAQCTPLTDSQSESTESSTSGPQSDAGSSVAGGSSEGAASPNGANSQADPNQPQWCFTPPPLRVIALAPHLMDFCQAESWRQLVPNN